MRTIANISRKSLDTHHIVDIFFLYTIYVALKWSGQAAELSWWDILRVYCEGGLGLVIEKAKTVAATTAFD